MSRRCPWVARCDFFFTCLLSRGVRPSGLLRGRILQSYHIIPAAKQIFKAYGLKNRRGLGADLYWSFSTKHKKDIKQNSAKNKIRHIGHENNVRKSLQNSNNKNYPIFLDFPSATRNSPRCLNGKGIHAPSPQDSLVRQQKNQLYTLTDMLFGEEKLSENKIAHRYLEKRDIRTSFFLRTMNNKEQQHVPSIPFLTSVISEPHRTAILVAKSLGRPVSTSNRSINQFSTYECYYPSCSHITSGTHSLKQQYTHYCTPSHQQKSPTKTTLKRHVSYTFSAVYIAALWNITFPTKGAMQRFNACHSMEFCAFTVKIAIHNPCNKQSSSLNFPSNPAFLFRRNCFLFLMSSTKALNLIN
ncbi:hypothetical protein ANPL_02725 [Anaplasma platys]|uniref:Uncharacterized protein n=1 Tax=Anaplasma platys TaxID=949 RepID=A0A858PYF8_9RICK|nr:hypothetical protein ANPL_02725 [Anaplasma platys]